MNTLTAVDKNGNLIIGTPSENLDFVGSVVVSFPDWGSSLEQTFQVKLLAPVIEDPFSIAIPRLKDPPESQYEVRTGQDIRISLGRPLSDLGNDDRFDVTVTVSALTHDKIEQNSDAPVTYDSNNHRINMKSTQVIFDKYAHLVQTDADSNPGEVEWIDLIVQISVRSTITGLRKDYSFGVKLINEIALSQQAASAVSTINIATSGVDDSQTDTYSIEAFKPSQESETQEAPLKAQVIDNTFGENSFDIFAWLRSRGLLNTQ